MTIFWHRRDLRASDNRGLAAAAADGDTVPVFVFDDAVLDHAGDARVRFMLDSLAELREAYRERGSDLVVARGDPAELLPALAAAVDAEAVHWNADYSGLAQERDARVEDALADAGVAAETHHDAVLHEPGTIRTNAGEPYSVYTYFWKKWRDREKPDPFPAPDSGDLADGDALAAGELADALAGEFDIDDALRSDLPSIEDLGFGEPEADVQAGGTAAAHDRLESFRDEPVFSYEADREYPARAGSSRLSPHLKFGTIGIRTVYEATEAAMADARERDERTDDDSETEDDELGPAASSVETFQSQLAWREFYAQVLYFNPEVVSQNYKEYEEPIQWRDDPEELAAWKAGETGYPIVDAGMRQLRDEAWMHNRVRMIVASFLTKDLLIDWRAGYDHFREHLADHDTANDTGGWQWAASTGTDAQPYFRIFNPATQGERYDPDAEYIREYVPELRGVDADAIHDWPDLTDEERTELAPDYADPIVDHGERREQALAMYKRARGEEPDEA
ncbi:MULTISPECIES: cryptochrome/photolyase family protein [Halolamina]|uniref:Deoxyribodipyrimidine photo-lyase n=1 Tax=Halolamina pelagica TaxID=699431 RepID=A0A1I5R1C8_9EURY|nr:MULTISPECIES: deoxyribodipyrimidine photo-lyase [Halolamina]NHX35632.1 deoxyribodipyrimidine photo-lyase [Halolamina sp. R1-12]SFP52111.1 deoxyribodipyrimidine photo-lyase [Halolamina pelagica]